MNHGHSSERDATRVVNRGGRAKTILRLIKNHPLYVLIGICATVLGFVKGIPPAWDAAMKISGKPRCYSFANTYEYAGGYLSNRGNNWVEDDGVSKYNFRELRRDEDYIYLQNLTTRQGRKSTMLVRLPACGGAAQWTYENPMSWTDLHQVWRK